MPKRKMLSPRKEKLGNLPLEINIITSNIQEVRNIFSNVLKNNEVINSKNLKGPN